MKRFLLPASALVLVLAACGAGSKSAPRVTNASTQVHPSVMAIAITRARGASLEAENLLQRIPLPPGATRLRHGPPGDGNLSQSGLGTSVITMFAERHSFWRVPPSVADTIAFEKRHMLPHLRWGSGGGPPGGYQHAEFYGPVAGGHPLQRMVSVSADTVGNRTIVRIDAAAAWIYPRASSEVVPASVREVDVRRGGVAKRVTDHAKVAQIVRRFDGLNVTPPGVTVICGAELSTPVRFVFRSAGGAKLASATVPSEPADGCNQIQFRIGDKQQTPLIDARYSKYAFVNRVQRLLGVCFRDPTRACR